jgi:hypothetical protein
MPPNQDLVPVELICPFRETLKVVKTVRTRTVSLINKFPTTTDSEVRRVEIEVSWKQRQLADALYVTRKLTPNLELNATISRA